MKGTFKKNPLTLTLMFSLYSHTWLFSMTLCERKYSWLFVVVFCSSENLAHVSVSHKKAKRLVATVQ